MSKTVKLAGTAGAFVVAGAAATLLNGRQRTRRRRRRGEDVEFGTVRSDGLTVVASDGVPLHVEVDEADRKTPTIVFLHGWVENIDIWHYQRLALRGQVRMVFLDSRSHGRSGRASVTRSTLADLADDVLTVIDQLVPRGPIVLVGHSMGGMTIMQLARTHPELFGRRIKGVVLLGTSSGQLMRTSPALRYLVPMLRTGAPVLDWGRRFNSYSVIRRWGLGPAAAERHADMANEMILQAPTHVLVDFYPNFVDLDLEAGLAALGRARTTVVGGTADLLTPVRHSRRLADLIPDAKLVVLPDVGHMLMFEDHEAVTQAIEDVLADVREDM
ncbi:alpha/beta fold hydrolase [Aeromicrobium wangtongii]|uniref:Alpha/beta hydrolase n=1 Tax=Aeromicrobium wangtongii TaxID=2969247 RepID=A0ABY5M805_9ACTN|nr:alpha/beta hydrolase [Aeromicrobium wangtongii]MCD9198832.1 alpha/beta hydrolase [Aeromicrobium wangtongii]UUP13128.1 alpha/beta hydrolase [Aeromicrobium wangtongii]